MAELDQTARFALKIAPAKAVRMWQSQVIREWKTAGRLEEKRGDLLLVLRKRFRTEVPAELAQKIEQTTGLGVLTGWLSAATEAPSLDAFRSAMRAPSPPPTESS